MHGVPDQGNTEIYTMQGSNLNPHLATPVFEHTETMNGEGIPEYVIDPALYYPTASNYGYYCTGYETPNEWDDHQRVFGLDSGDIPYVGAQTENLSYAYYTPAYGFGEYNPYNPYIPGAMVGVDGQYVGSQPYYSVSPYQNPVSSSAYIPVAGPPRPDAANSSLDPLLDTVPSTINRVTYGAKHSQSSSSVTLAKNSSKIGPGQSLGKISDGGRINSGTNRRVAAFRGSSAGNHGTSSFGPQSGSDNGVHGAVLPQQNQMKMSLFLDSGLSDFGPNSNARAAGDGNWSKFYQRRALCDTSGVPDSLSEQNRGPRTNRSKNQLVVKAYTTKAGDPDSQGNIVISADNYNRNDFPVDYGKAKFFVIKSYSEDDVHKSIKYNVWSSTPNGNKKLSTGYEEAQQVAAGKSGGCPIFLFFSVNASGQFCGVAEMVGPVDFDKDMDFWQQDKWSGSFPVKWHFIKDVPNTNFRHIILENNEHKPVTNSRDTQEILYKPGIEMLKLFKNYVPKTSLLDDFMYYENRQRIMLEERSRFLSKGIARAFRPLVEVTAPELALKEATNETVISENQDVSGEAALAAVQNSASTTLDKSGDDISSAVGVKKNELKPSGDDMVSTLKIGSLTINHKQSSHKSISAPTTKVGVGGPVEVVTVGSMPVKVNGHNNSRQSTGLLTVGSITIDPKSLRTETSGLSRKGGTLPLK